MNNTPVFIFHGLFGHSGENWFPWIKEQIDNSHQRGIVPDFPHADQPILSEWIETMDQYTSLINSKNNLSLFITEYIAICFSKSIFAFDNIFIKLLSNVFILVSSIDVIVFLKFSLLA